jgi:hypothetical protein
METFVYFGATVTNQNDIYDKISNMKFGKCLLLLSPECLSFHVLSK